MDADLQDFMAAYEGVIKNIEHLTFLTREVSLQTAGIGDAERFLEDSENTKTIFVSTGREDGANLILAASSAMTAMKLQIEMYVALKSADPDKAWGLLVNAQSAARDAICAHRGFAGMKAVYDHLIDLETMLFPPQVFMSTGYIVLAAECSICDADYEACWHLIGKPYWGKICHRKITSAEVDHIAVVPNPANKHCRITHFADDGGKRNRMTWVVEPSVALAAAQPDKGTIGRADAILYGPGDLDELSEAMLMSMCSAESLPDA